MSTEAITLRDQVVKSGTFLILRQVIGMFVGIVGMLVLSRIIGPGNYGLYASIIGILGFLSSISGLGLNIFLIRAKEEPEQDYNRVFTVLILSNTLAVLTGIMLSDFLGRWLHNIEVIKPFSYIIITLLLSSVTLPCFAKLERDFNYRTVAIVELMGQIVYYLVSIPMAIKGYGYWSAIVGYIFQQTTLAAGALYFAKLKLRLAWSPAEIIKILKYGFGYSSSMWIWYLRGLVNPLIVGRFVGIDVVGYIAQGIRLVEVLSFARTATWRISFAAMAKIQNNFERLKRVMEEAMLVQVLTLGPFLIVFAALGKWIIPITVGNMWIPMLDVYPYIAISLLVNSIFSMHSSILYVLKRNWDVAVFHTGHIILFAGSAWLFVRNFGFLGYGFAEISALAAYLIVHKKLATQFAASYKKVIPYVVVQIPPLFIPSIDSNLAYILLLPMLILFLLPSIRREMNVYILHFTRRTL